VTAVDKLIVVASQLSAVQRRVLHQLDHTQTHATMTTTILLHNYYNNNYCYETAAAANNNNTNSSDLLLSMLVSGVLRIWQRGEGHGKHAERQPITGVWGQSPQRGPGAESLVGGSGGKAPLKLKHFLLLNVQWKPQIRPFFWNLETQKTIKHCWILQFLLENGKKCTFSSKVACKNFHGRAKGGITPCPPP